LNALARPSKARLFIDTIYLKKSMSHPTHQSLQRKEDPLARHIAQTFHDLDCLRSYIVCCGKYSPAIVQRAFKDAQSVPQARIKKSRAALFFYLVKHYAHQAPDNSGD
jgi:hypothetical protein